MMTSNTSPNSLPGPPSAHRAPAEAEWVSSATCPQPIISLIMAAWQAERTIDEAVHSILSQRGISFELIILDDASTDRTPDRITTLRDARLTVGRLSQRLTPAAVRNCAIRQARAPWIGIFDADDVMEKQTLADYVKKTFSAPGCSWAYCGLRFTDEQGRATGEEMRTPFDLLKMLQRNIVSHPMSLYTRELYDRAGGYRETLRSREDYDLWLRFLLHTEPLFHDHLCVRYRRHPGAIGARKEDSAPLNARQVLHALLPPIPSASRQPQRLQTALDFLDAAQQHQWNHVLALNKALTHLDVTGFEKDRHTVEALRATGRPDEAFPLIFSRIRQLAAGEKLLPYEQTWALTQALDLLLAADLLREAAALLALAEVIAEQHNDPELNRLIAAVHRRNN